MSENILSYMSLLNDPILLIKTVGYVGLFLIVFAETGLLFGFFLPGDSLLVSAGLLSSYGDNMSLQVLIILLSIAAISGDTLGFYIGHKLKNTLYRKKDSFFFRKKHLNYANEFYQKHGGKTIVFARFIPIIRTFAPTVAGAASMNYAKFATYNILGGIGWVLTTLLAGYYLGKIFGEKVQNYIHFIIIGIIIVSLLPIIFEGIKKRKTK